MPLELAQRVIWTTSVFAAVVAIGTLLQRRLARSYPFFLTFLVAQVVASDLLLQVKYESTAYTEAWRWYACVMVALRIGVAGEVFGHIAGHFVGIGRFRIWVGAIALALGGFFVWAGFTPLAPPVNYPQTVAFVIERWETLTLAGALALSWLFLTRVFDSTTPIRSNTSAHWKLIAAYFVIDGVWIAAAIVESRMSVWYAENIVALAGETVCLTAWIALLTREGQKKPEVPALTEQEVALVMASGEQSFDYVRSLPGRVKDRARG